MKRKFTWRTNKRLECPISYILWKGKGDIMFDYKEFKMEMSKRGHEVHKNGTYITVEPNNNYEGYVKGFMFATDVISGFENFLQFIRMDHFNTWIFSAKFKIV